MTQQLIARSLLGMASALFVCSQSGASFNSNAATFAVVSTAGTATANDTATLLAPGVYSHTGLWAVPGASISWTSNVLGWSEATRSGFLNSNIVIKNNTASTQTFTFSVVMPGDVTGPVTIGGSVGGQFVNGSAGLGQLTSSGPLWSAIIDGAPINTQLSNALFFAPPFAVASLGSYNFSNQSFGGSIASGAGITFALTMTAGGEASFSSNFNFQAIPAPGALALLGFATLAGARRRRN